MRLFTATLSQLKGSASSYAAVNLYGTIRLKPMSSSNTRPCGVTFPRRWSEPSAKLDPQPQHVLIDGLPVRPFPIGQTALVGGDGLSFSIAAASVIAIVTRDRIMVAMDVRYPGYEFAQHKGYGTALHLAKLRAHGPCAIHRRSFSPVRQAVLPLV